MATDPLNPATPADTDPIGAPANGIQQHMRDVKSFLVGLNQKIYLGIVADPALRQVAVPVTYIEDRIGTRKIAAQNVAVSANGLAGTRLDVLVLDTIAGTYAVNVGTTLVRGVPTFGQVVIANIDSPVGGGPIPQANIEYQVTPIKNKQQGVQVIVEDTNLSTVADNVIALPTGNYKYLDIVFSQVKIATAAAMYLQPQNFAANNCFFGGLITGNSGAFPASTGAVGDGGAGTNCFIPIAGGGSQILDVSTVTTNPINLRVRIWNPAIAGEVKDYQWECPFVRFSGGAVAYSKGGGRVTTVGAVTSLAMRLRNSFALPMPAAGSVFPTSGTYRIEGLI